MSKLGTVGPSTSILRDPGYGVGRRNDCDCDAFFSENICIDVAFSAPSIFLVNLLVTRQCDIDVKPKTSLPIVQ